MKLAQPRCKTKKLNNMQLTVSLLDGRNKFVKETCFFKKCKKQQQIITILIFLAQKNRIFILILVYGHVFAIIISEHNITQLL